MNTETSPRENKKLAVIETSIIGFFVGVIIAAYLAFVSATGGFIGLLVSYVSLRPLLDHFNIPDSQILVVSFIFVVLVYTVYGGIIGLLIKVLRVRTVIVPTILILGAMGAEQTLGTTQNIATNDSLSQTAAVAATIIPHKHSSAPEQTQYFGVATSSEATGDLNGDGINDVAFIVDRADTDRGALYYLIASLATSTGHTGTNLVFLGDKVKPHDISIENETIIVSYTLGTATTTHKFYAKVTAGTLKQASSTATVATTTVVSTI